MVFTCYLITYLMVTSVSCLDSNVSYLYENELFCKFQFDLILSNFILVDGIHFQKQTKTSSILERDVTLTCCYNQTRVLIMQHSQNSVLPTTEIAVYTISK